MTEFDRFPTHYWAWHKAEEIAIVWKRGDSEFFSSLPDHLSWAQLQQLIFRTIAFLQQNGGECGSLIAYLGNHRLAGLLCYLASVSIGARVVMLNPALTSTQQAEILQSLGVDLQIDEATFIEFAKNSEDLTPCPSAFSFEVSKAATLTLTSGSSGLPKAVVHSIQHHLANAEGVCELMNFSPQQSWLLSLPLFHVSGQGIVWRWLAQGAMLYVAENKMDFYHALSKVSHASLVPTQLQRYLAQGKVIRGQKILLGGAFIPPELIKQAQALGVDTFAGYGMTEMASTICAVQGERDNVGLPLKRREVKIEKDEIWVRGAGLGLGYWQNNQLTPFTNEQGWLQTKDRGAWRNGKLVVKGRLDNQFISGGENIQPEQIEAVLLQSGLLTQAFVVPIDDAHFGQRPVAVVEFLGEFSVQGVRSLQYFASQHLEKFKLPVSYLPLPVKMQTGLKISRTQLKSEITRVLERKE